MSQVYVSEIQTYELSIARNVGDDEIPANDFRTYWSRFIKLNLIPGRFGYGVMVAEIAF